MLIVIHGSPAFQALVIHPKGEPKQEVCGQLLIAMEESASSAHTLWGLEYLLP